MVKQHCLNRPTPVIVIQLNWLFSFLLFLSFETHSRQMCVVQCTLTPDLFTGVFLGWMTHTRDPLGQLFKKLLHAQKKITISRVLIWKSYTDKNGRVYFHRLQLLKWRVFPWSSTERLEIWSATAWHTEFPTSSLIF